jgi:hypothetical protein
MRTEKISLRDHLWKRRVPEFDDPGCNCGEGRQTVSHVLLRLRGASARDVRVARDKSAGGDQARQYVNNAVMNKYVPGPPQHDACIAGKNRCFV